VTPEPVRQPEQASGVLVTAGARELCRAVGTTAWAVLCDVTLDAGRDPEGRLVAATNVRRIADHFGISKDTAARALARLGHAGLVGRGSARSESGRFVASAYVVHLGDVAGITLLAGRSCPVDPVSGRCGHGRRPGQRGHLPVGDTPLLPACVIPAPAGIDGADIAVPAGRSAEGRLVMGVACLEPVSVVQESRTPVVVDHDDRAVRGHHAHAVTAQHLAQPDPAHIHTEPPTTTPAASPDHAHDALASTVHNASHDHHQNRLRHWHPAVPFPRAAVTGAAEAAKAAPC
jgi:hypothetical protein